MIQDIAPWRLRNEFMDAAPEPGDLVIDMSPEGVLTPEGELSFPTVEEWRAFGMDAALLYAFRLVRQGEGGAAESTEERFFLALREKGAEAPAPQGWRRAMPAALRGEFPGPMAYAAATGWHLFLWYDTARHCGRCGEKLAPSATERAMLCPACKAVHYPRIAPCVIVAVTSGEKLLLTRYARPGAKNLVLVAGFVEAGETAEEAARREVMEETGLKVKHLRYFGSQPWGFSGTLARGYVAELDGPDEIRLDTSELAESLWVERSHIPPCPDSASLTMEMISRFSRGEL